MAVKERERERGERREEEEIAGAAGDKFPRNKAASAKENKVSTRARILVRSVSFGVLRARQVFDLPPVEIRPTNRIHVEAIPAFSFVDSSSIYLL